MSVFTHDFTFSLCLGILDKIRTIDWIVCLPMKILIFSDTHLDNRYDVSKYNFLKKIITASDRVIINGDFWDSWFTSFDGFIKSKWSLLFPLLLKKKAVYIYGDHDPQKRCDRRVSLFSVACGNYYNFKFKGINYHITHGKKILKDKRPKMLEMYCRMLDKVEDIAVGKLLHYLLHFLEYLGYKLMGVSLMTASNMAKLNNQIIKQSGKKGEWLICGDTHCAEIDRKNLFANSGCINYGHASYITIVNDQISLHQEYY